MGPCHDSLSPLLSVIFPLSHSIERKFLRLPNFTDSLGWSCRLLAIFFFMAASPSSSTSTWPWQHDVFLCYRARDTFDNFVCHLQTALRRATLDFFSEENFKRGEDIASAISGAIERSKVAVVIFSKGFADSEFCLNNLVKILECREFLRQVVIPIFYDVDPFDVRTQRGRCYWRAFARHEGCLSEDSEQLKIWRRALAIFGYSAGARLSTRDTRHDAELVDLIVKEIGKELEQASSIGLKSPHEYDVFLSFRGPDTRHGFTHDLDGALRGEGIRTFIDDGGIMKGELIEQSILTAIEESKIAVIIFSEKYASSQYCLDELVKIIQCRNLLGQAVIPVFYDVPTSVVSDQTGSFEVAFTEHEKVYEEEFEKVYLWRRALKIITDICGWDVHAMSKSESELLGKVVGSVLQRLKQTSSTNAKGMEELPVSLQAPTCLPDMAMTESTQIHGKRSRPTSSEGELPSSSPFDCPPGRSSSSGIKVLMQSCNKLVKTGKEFIKNGEEFLKTVEEFNKQIVDYSSELARGFQAESQLDKVEQEKAKQMERLEHVKGVDDQREGPAEDLGESIEGSGGLCEVKSSAGGA